MEKYLIVNTFNGEGYSDSNAIIMEFESIEEARATAISMAKENADNDSLVVVENDRVMYGCHENENYEEENPLDNCEDTGAIHYAILGEDTEGILIKPMINEFTQLTNSEIDGVIETLMESEESEEGEDIEGTCHHLEDSTEIFFKIDSIEVVSAG